MRSPDRWGWPDTFAVCMMAAIMLGVIIGIRPR